MPPLPMIFWGHIGMTVTQLVLSIKTAGSNEEKQKCLKKFLLFLLQRVNSESIGCVKIFFRINCAGSVNFSGNGSHHRLSGDRDKNST